MLNAFASGFSELAKKPIYFLPALLAMAINFFVLIFTAENYFNFFYEVFIYGEVPQASLFQLPYYMLTTYTTELLVIGAAVFVSFLLGFYQLYAYASLLKKNKGVLEGIVSGFSKIGEIAGLTAFACAAFFLYSIAWFLLFIGSVSDSLGLIAFVLLLAWTIFGAYVYLKLAFTPVIMAVEGAKLKEALAKSWKWSGKRLGKLLLFFILLGIIAGAINTFFSILADAAGIEMLALALLVIGLAVSNAYNSIVLVKYLEEPG